MYKRRPSLLIVYAFLVTTSIGCAQQTAADEAGLVPDSIMTEVFIEFHLLEARTDLFNEDVIKLRDSIMIHHGIDTVAYERTMDYYANHPEIYMKVYSDALDKLSDERYLQDD